MSPLTHRSFRCSLLLVLLLTVVLISGFCNGESSASASASSLSTSLIRDSTASDRSSGPGRSLLSLPITRIGAALDGTISLRDSNGRVSWTFGTGTPIYSSYQAPVQATVDQDNASELTNSFFIDCGEDWGLYAHVNNEQLVKSGLTNTAELQHKEPYLLFITRTDYTLQSFEPNSDNVSWSMTVAEIGYAFLCQDFENPFIGATMNTSYELGPEIGHDFDLPFACQSKGIIQRFRKHNNSDSSRRDNHGKPKMLPAPAPDPMAFMQPKADKLSELHHNDGGEGVLTLPPLETRVSGIVDAYDVRTPYKNVLSMLFEQSTALSLLLLAMTVVGFVVRNSLVAKGQFLLSGHPSLSNSRTAASKRKKVCKLGKNGAVVEKKVENMSSGNENGFSISKDASDPFLDLNKLVRGGAQGRNVGKLFVSNTEIAKGSNGTVVYEGIYEGRPVAVKRLVRALHDVAFKEIQNLIASDQHPNIVRWYGVENDKDFVYLSLERCMCSLDDLIQTYSDSSCNSVFGEDQATRAMIEYKLRLDSVKVIIRDLSLWKANGHPSPLLLSLMRDLVSGLVHLHELGIIHRDLKPQNVLIIKERSLCAKLSDMGISRRLLGDMSSLGCGSSGWQAPEQLLHGRQTRAVDLFSLGCVLFFCITGGQHPFGDRLERDINITKNQVDLFLLGCIPEAEDLISRLLNPDPQLRPCALEVLHHPLFWSSEMRLSFLRDTSDRVELEDRETDSNLLKALESSASVSLGAKWDEKIEPIFITNIGRYRRYKFDSVRDLLRVVRNKLNHYRELPEEIQELVGPVPEGFDGYFATRFPRLLIEVYKVVSRYCREEECFHKYFKSN
ncbi:serine/threonine-protein kinase/endoribonuclease IRE1a [Citrus sinensis]|nr:serine/threonine-protein kinase/endoribonuclease IRE1a [Citrus sinensis]